jgi:hypothetical protein
MAVEETIRQLRLEMENKDPSAWHKYDYGDSDEDSFYTNS